MILHTLEEMIIDKGQYLFRLIDGIERMGIFTRIQDRINWFSIQELVFTNIPGPVEDISSPVLLEVQHVALNGVLIEAETDSITIINNIYIVHVDHFVDRSIPYRQGMANIAAIHEHKELFPPYKHEDANYKHVNEEHMYLCSRIAICEVFRYHSQSIIYLIVSTSIRFMNNEY